MKTDLVLKHCGKLALIAALVFVSLSFGKVQAEEDNSNPQQSSASGPGRYQAIYAGMDESGSGHHHLIIIVDTHTGKLDKTIYYEDGIDKQEITDFTNQEIVKIKLGGKEEHSKIVR
jgi:hypothetical protein